MYEHSTTERTWYFFCAAGINITLKLLNSLNPPAKTTEELVDLDSYFLTYRDIPEMTDTQFEEEMQKLYRRCFSDFDELWCKSQPTNIMNFTQFLSDVFTTRFKEGLR